MASDATPDTEPYEGRALRVFGPPGTGKTTYLAQRVRATVAEHGPDSLLLASFSVTAAQEIGSRFGGEGVAPNPKMIGTLHSHAYQANGPTSVALDSRVLADWNESVSPELHITPDTRRSGGSSGIDSGALSADPETARTGDELIGVLDRLRAAMVPPEEWPDNVRTFAERWTAWKRDVGAVDYTDMIEVAYLHARDGEKAPRDPDYIVVDEAQDMTPLESALALAWGRHAGTLVLGMDDDQAINQWRGGDPEPLLALHGPDVSDHVLDRSYRVPESVRAVAERWVRRLSLRREKVYQSRLDEAGEVVIGIARRSARTLRDPGLVEDIAAEVDAGHTVMVIAACNYMLEPLLTNLRREGMPFHNPYRPAEQRWNPLGAPTREGAMSTMERIVRYLSVEQADWTGADLQAWSELVKLSDAHMVRGAKAAIKQMGATEVIPYERIAALFADTPEGEAALRQAVEPDVSFLEGALLKARRDAAAYPIQVARQRGSAALKEAPKLVVGTVHSVKGATSDIVYVCPDISDAARRTMAHRRGVDEVIRLFYVAMTRSFAELRLLAPATRTHLRTDELLPTDLEVTG